jgi:competence protein ComFC
VKSYWRLAAGQTQKEYQRRCSMFRKLLFDLKEGFLDILYPPDLSCILCGEEAFIVPGYSLCRPCFDQLPFIRSSVCGVCGRPMDKGEICPDCSVQDHHFHQACSVFEYSPEIQKLIYRFKYGGQTYLAPFLGRCMAEKLESMENRPSIQGLVPVPLHPNRRRKRGFNQAELMAREMEKRTGIPVLDRVLIRKRDTSAQAGLRRLERMENMANAFAFRNREEIQSKILLLIDDIYTTGATAEQCSRVLMEAGASRVYVMTAATVRIT